MEKDEDTYKPTKLSILYFAFFQNMFLALLICVHIHHTNKTYTPTVKASFYNQVGWTKEKNKTCQRNISINKSTRTEQTPTTRIPFYLSILQVFVARISKEINHHSCVVSNMYEADNILEFMVATRTYLNISNRSTSLSGLFIAINDCCRADFLHLLQSQRRIEINVRSMP